MRVVGKFAVVAVFLCSNNDYKKGGMKLSPGKSWRRGVRLFVRLFVQHIPNKLTESRVFFPPPPTLPPPLPRSGASFVLSRRLMLCLIKTTRTVKHLILCATRTRAELLETCSAAAAAAIAKTASGTCFRHVHTHTQSNLNLIKINSRALQCVCVSRAYLNANMSVRERTNDSIRACALSLWRRELRIQTLNGTHEHEHRNQRASAAGAARARTPRPRQPNTATRFRISNYIDPQHRLAARPGVALRVRV